MSEYFFKTNENCILSNNDLTATFSTVGHAILGECKTSGKFYWEMKCEVTNNICIGVGSEVIKTLTGNFATSSNQQICFYGGTGNYYDGISNYIYGNSFSSYPATISIFLDIDNKKIKFALNGTIYSEIILPSWNSYYPYILANSTVLYPKVTGCFKRSSFSYSNIIPTGYLPYEVDLNEATSSLSYINENGYEKVEYSVPSYKIIDKIEGKFDLILFRKEGDQ